MFGFVLCADDYAMTEGVSRGIVELLEAGRLTATGAMTNRPHWRDQAPALLPFLDTADLGVHLNLTLGAPLTAMPEFAPDGVLPPLKKIIPAALRGTLPMTDLVREINAQLAAFEEHIGGIPDFIDGHQHVHGLPMVRDALLSVVEARYHASLRPYIRMSGDRVARLRARSLFMKKALIVKGLSTGFRRAARRRGLKFNDGFAGFSDFDPNADYAVQFASYLKAPGPRHLVMCHPGYVDAELKTLDPVTDAREIELAFFRSEAFEVALTAAGAEMVRFGQSDAPRSTA